MSQIEAISPAALIRGRNDRSINLEFSQRLVSLVPNFRLHVFNRCGYWAQIEHAPEFDALIHSFLSLN